MQFLSHKKKCLKNIERRYNENVMQPSYYWQLEIYSKICDFRNNDLNIGIVFITLKQLVIHSKLRQAFLDLTILKIQEKDTELKRMIEKKIALN